MNGTQAIERLLQVSDYMLKTYLEGIEDSELTTRPTENANHLAWQLGHIIAAENEMMEWLKPGSSPQLPEGFTEKHSSATAGNDEASFFLTKNEYLELYDQQRSATYAILHSFTDEELDKPGPKEMRSYAPTIGCVMVHQGDHTLLHTGQMAVIRRKLGKEILI